jgi:hypothetical protein
MASAISSMAPIMASISMVVAGSCWPGCAAWPCGRAGCSCFGLGHGHHERSLRYVPRPALDAAVAGAATRPLGDAGAWARKGLSTDITPLVAVSLARWGHATRAHLHNREPAIYL